MTIDVSKGLYVSKNSVRQDVYSNATVHKTAINLEAEVFTMQHVLSDTAAIHFGNDEALKVAIKEEMAMKLARTLVESNLVEFTYLRDPHTFNYNVRAKCCITKREQTIVLIDTLRKNGVDCGY